MEWSPDSGGQEHDDSEHFRDQIRLEEFYPQNRSRLMFRVVPSFPDNHRHGGADAAPRPDRNENLFARNPWMLATWGAAWDHLTWRHACTPFISFFSDFNIAVRWKDHFLEDRAYRVQIFCYDTKHIRVLDANLVANDLGLHLQERVGSRHCYEYLVVGRVSGYDCRGVYEFEA
jgi:hypothetical protein